MCSGIAGLGDIDTMMVVDLYPIHVRITDSSVISETQFREILFNTFPEWATLRYVIEGGAVEADVEPYRLAILQALLSEHGVPYVWSQPGRLPLYRGATELGNSYRSCGSNVPREKEKGGPWIVSISIKGSFLSLDQYSRHRLKQNECFGL